MASEPELETNLDSPDHLKVCRALKAMAHEEALSGSSLEKIVRYLSSGVIAVERTALVCLEAIGPRAAGATEALTERLALRLKDAGCRYACCGLAAFNGPISAYVDTLRALTGISDEAAFRARIETVPISVHEKSFFSMRIGDADAA